MTAKQLAGKKVRLSLIGINGNAFAILGAFTRQAKRDGWTQEEIEAVMDEARSSDYNHLLSTIAGFCDDPTGDYEDEE